MNQIKPGFYRDKHGTVFNAAFVCLHTTDHEELVICKSPDGKIWAMPYALFTYCFKYIEEE